MAGVQFEWDESKSARNFEKHGIDFDSAKELFGDPDMVTIRSDYEFEERYLALGKIGDALWVAVFTYRDERVRLISVRRPHRNERRMYDE